MSKASDAVIEVTSLHKSFGELQVLKGLHFSLRKGEIHSLVGENGAGKSTLMNIVTGLLPRDTGEIKVNGQDLSVRSRHSVIGMVHQHFMIAPPMTPLEHILLENARKLSWYQPLPKAQTLKKMRDLSNQMELPVRWEIPAQKLPLGELQRVEILRVLSLGAEILIFDEPTAVLTPQESLELQRKLLHFKALGHSIILISHKLKEVLAISDRVSVLRSGELIATKDAKLWQEQELGEAMIGRPLKGTLKNLKKPSAGATLLEFENSSALKFSLRRGEILGIAGVEGNGQEELVEHLANPATLAAKHESIPKMTIDGASCLSDGPMQMRERGIGFLFADRHRQSVINSMSLKENYVLGNQDLLSRGGLIEWSSATAFVEKAKEQLSIKMGSVENAMSSLSGGNQQKFVVARETHRPIQMLIAHQPTRGVDLGAIELIHEKFIDLRNTGVGILLISSDLDELFALSSRIVVLFNGKIQAEFSREEIDKDPQLMSKLGLAMGGKS